MKSSQYNRFILLENGEYVVYNTLTGGLMIIDEEAKENIDKIHEKDVPSLIRDNLVKSGFIVTDDENELLLVRDRLNAKRFDPRLLSFFVTPTADCNLSCPYCWQRSDNSFADTSLQRATMSESTMNGVLQFIKHRAEVLRAHNLPITFFGGEPLMKKEMVLHILRNLSRWGDEHSVSITAGFYTNCTLLDQSFMEELQQYTLGTFRTSIDGPQKIHDIYRYYSNGKGTYEDTVTNIGLLLDSGVNLILQYNITSHYHHAPELFDDLAERGLKPITVDCHRLYDPSSVVQEVKKVYGVSDEKHEIHRNPIFPPFTEVSKAKMFIYRTAYEKGFALHPPKLGLLLPCNGSLYYHYVIDPLGFVYKCSTSMLLENLRVGRIYEDGNFEKYPFFHEWMDTDPTYIKECQACSLLPSCGGGCTLGRKLAQRPYLCDVSPFCGEEYIKLYLKQEFPDEFTLSTG